MSLLVVDVDVFLGTVLKWIGSRLFFELDDNNDDDDDDDNAYNNGDDNDKDIVDVLEILILFVGSTTDDAMVYDADMLSLVCVIIFE